MKSIIEHEAKVGSQKNTRKSSDPFWKSRLYPLKRMEPILQRWPKLQHGGRFRDF